VEHEERDDDKVKGQQVVAPEKWNETNKTNHQKVNNLDDTRQHY
jgi:hypothetical protein